MIKDIIKKFPKLDFKMADERLGYYISFDNRRKMFFVDENLFCYSPIGHYTGKMLMYEDNEEYEEYIIDVPTNKLTKKHKKEQFNNVVRVIKDIIKQRVK